MYRWLLVVFFAVSFSGLSLGAGLSPCFTPAELDRMPAPTALYPDSLLAQILLAATYPIEVAAADRWSKSHNQALRERYGQARGGDAAARYDYRGFDGRKDGDSGRLSADRGWNGRSDGDNCRREPANAFQGIGRGEDVLRFCERGLASRRQAGMAHRGGGDGRAASAAKGFAAPEDAVKALAAAIKAADTRALLALFGAGAKGIFSSGDEAADRAGRERFIQAYEEINQLERKDENRVVLHVGTNDWPFPVPIVRVGRVWSFDAREGREEMLNRRIGQNELGAIRVCLAIVDSQREYAAEDRNGDGVLEYAQRLLSDPGKKNGLYWPVAEGEEPSPLGPLIAGAVGEGAAGKQPAARVAPYHGYRYRILTAQGGQAEGGARDYLVKGKMIGGFAVVASPAEYGNSGIMSFIVNQEGVVYEKNLGWNTARTVSGMKTFDPDETWKRTEQ